MFFDHCLRTLIKGYVENLAEIVNYLQKQLWLDAWRLSQCLLLGEVTLNIKTVDSIFAVFCLSGRLEPY